LEQLRVNVNGDGSNTNSQNYWNTGLFVGAGYRSGNATIGARYNVLTDKNNIYGSAFMPFIRFILILPMPSKEGIQIVKKEN
jgi:hypothetical protein